MLHQRGPKKIKSHHAPTKRTGSFHECIWAVLVYFRSIGLLPLSVRHRNEKLISISWKSPYNVFIYIPSVVLQSLYILVQLYKFSIELITIESTIVYIVVILETQLMLRFCLKLNELTTDIESIENLLTPMKRPRSLMRFLKRFLAVFFCVSIGEIFVNIGYEIERTAKCFLQTDDSGLYLKSYFEFTLAGVYEIFPFSYTMSFIYVLIKFQAAMSRYLCDAFIMTICIYLNNRFRDFNRLIIQKEFSFQKCFRPTWKELQVQYTRLCQLVTMVDESINVLVFIAYSYNLFHICQQVYFFLDKLTIHQDLGLHDCLKEMHKGWVSVVYMMYSMAFMFMEIGLLSHLAAELHDSSRKPLDVLHTAPSADYNCDMLRLMNQVYHSEVGISGLRLFQITRGAVLATIAQLMTYELVLVQFDIPDDNLQTFDD